VKPYGAPEWYFSAHFVFPTPPKSTLKALLGPLFGQFQKVNSQKFARNSSGIHRRLLTWSSRTT
jgi:hypothetical protein